MKEASAIFAFMKLPFKHIAILVIISLTGIFAYQAYWLTGLYHTMKNDMERSIIEAMHMSDYNEMMLRIDKMREDANNHGEVTVSAGYADDGNAYVKSSTKVSNSMSDSSEIHVDSTDQEADDAMLTSNIGLDVMLRGQNDMKELATYFQRGIHSGIDIVLETDVQCFDSLLTLELTSKGIHLPHRILLLYTSSTSSNTFTDTLGMAGDSTYIPSTHARCYEYSFDIHKSHTYYLWMEPVSLLVLKQMSGILTTSFIILIILGVAFWYLIRTILRQKTLEELKSDFTNNITHELKTPIAVAYAANDALLNFNQAEEKEKRNQYLRICQEQLHRLSGMVEQILSSSMEDRKSFHLHLEQIDLEDLIVSLIEQHKLKAGKPIRISYDSNPPHLSVTADRTHFSNIISNLLDNAVKYSTEEIDINIHCRKLKDDIEISVTDHGTGITVENQKQIFDKFYRVPTGNRHNVKGYGLGLYYVKTIIEKHGGTVRVKSEPGRGSTFTLTL